MWILYYKKVIDAILSKMLIGTHLFISKCWCIYILCFQNVLWSKSQTTKKEIGTIIQRDGKVIPIEVKSGNTRANSLKSIMKNNKDISFGYKFIDGNIGASKEGIITLPLYMVAFFDI